MSMVKNIKCGGDHLHIFVINHYKPRKMNTTKAIPIYKAGDEHALSNYRPVSLLPHVSKIL